MCCEELRERRLYWRLYLCTLRWIIHKTLVEATRESDSKETVSNEKDSNLKRLLSLSSSPALPPSLPLSSSLSQDLSPFFCLGHSVLFLERSWSTAYLKTESPHSAVMERAKLCFYVTKTFWERRTKSIIAQLLRSFFIFSVTVLSLLASSVVPSIRMWPPEQSHKGPGLKSKGLSHTLLWCRNFPAPSTS